MLINEIQNNFEKFPVSFSEPLRSRTLWLIVTNRCNINCKYCYNYINEHYENMSPELAVGILEAYFKQRAHLANPEEIFHILFFGGEPTINPETIYAVTHYLREHKIKAIPHLLTNGIMPDAVLERLISEKMIFQLSFDGIKNNVRLTKSGHNNIHPIVQKTLNKVVKSKLPIHIRATVHDQNVNFMHEVVEFAAANDVESIAFCPVYLDGNAKKYGVKQPDKEIYLKNYIKAHQRAKELGIDFVISDEKLLDDHSKYPLQPPLVWLPGGSVSHTIKYASTDTLEAQQAMIGKFDRQAGLIKFYEPKLKQLQNDFIKNSSSQCSGCPIYSKCKGLNNLDDYSLNIPDKDKKNYFCHVALETLQYFYLKGTKR